MTARALKPTWVTRRLPTDLALSWGAPHDPQVADLLLCEVVRTALHGRVETTSGSRMKLYAGDQIICAVGNRYATALLEAAAEAATARIDLLSASGVCGRVLERAHTTNRPTSLQVLGQAFSAGHPVNLRSFSLGPPPLAAGDPSWVVVVGSAMDSGKTTACASLIHGLTAAGLRVGAAKLTGTASARDFGAFRDAGAAPVLDFLDVGWPSTMGCTTEDLRGILQAIAGHLRAAPLDWAVLEIADGLLQWPTTRGFIQSRLGPTALPLPKNMRLPSAKSLKAWDSPLLREHDTMRSS